MTTTTDFDRLISSWLETSGPSAMDPTVVDEALTNARRIERRRGLKAIVLGPRGWPNRPNQPAWRSLPMNRMLVALGATVAILVAGFALWPRPATGPGSAATPSPSAPGPSAAILSTSGSPVSLGDPLPDALKGRWMGGNNSLVPPGAGSSMVLDSSNLALSASNNNQTAVLTTDAGASGGELRLRTAAAGYCLAGQMGRYQWSLSPTGRVLTLAVTDDPCATRATAVGGTWSKSLCRDPQTDCLGDLDAGTHVSQYITPLAPSSAVWSPLFGGVTYTVPDGWANWTDYPGVFGLTTSSDYAATTPGNLDPAAGILVLNQAQGSWCVGSAPDSVTATPTTFLDWMRGLKGLGVGPTQAFTLDGRAAAWADIELQPRSAQCEPTEYMVAGGLHQGIASNERQRLVIVDAGSGNLLAIVIYAPKSVPFPDFATAAMNIVDSMSFK